jgi:ferric-dicitrate binding protein FerR (iron transport regulator)
MATLHVRPLRCERARRWASLGPDDALSELERARLERHLDGCAECARFAAEVEALARVLRGAPLEAPPRSFAPAPRRRERRLVGAVRAAAVAAVAVGALGLAGAAERDGRPPAARLDVAVHGGPDTTDQLRDLRRREVRDLPDTTTPWRELLLPL